MVRERSPDDICAFCDEYSVCQADPEQAAIGMGRCLMRTDGKLATHVAWDNRTCIGFRLDRVHLVKRRQYVQVQRINQQETPP